MTAPLLISATELRASICFQDLIDPMAEAFRQSSAGGAQNGLIVMFPADTPEDGDVYVKTGALRGCDIHIVKIAPWFAANAREGQPQGGFVAVFDSRTGHARAIITDEHYLSDIRTAATGALVTQWLAPDRVETVAVLGTGTQAYLQALAVHNERPFDRLLIWGRDPAKANSLAVRLHTELPYVACDVALDVEKAVRGADVLITATLSRQPIVQGDWLKPGQLVIAVGADDPTKCELAPAAFLRARVFVDARETAAANGDVLHAIKAGHFFDQLVAGELGDVISGKTPGRLSRTDIVIAKLVGIGAQDVMAAQCVMSRFAHCLA
jgi:ornithine cyclodeaminase